MPDVVFDILLFSNQRILLPHYSICTEIDERTRSFFSQEKAKKKEVCASTLPLKFRSEDINIQGSASI